MNPQNLFVSLLIIPHRLDRETIVRVVPDGLCWQQYCQFFSRNVSCFCLLPCTTSILVLSHAEMRILSSFTLKLVPHLSLLEMVISTSGGELETDIGLFWDTPNKGS